MKPSLVAGFAGIRTQLPVAGFVRIRCADAAGTPAVSGIRLTCCALLLAVVAGCRSGSPCQSAIQHFDQGNAAAAIVELDTLSQKRRQESEILALDRAVARVMAGDTKAAAADLEAARRQLDYLSQKDITEQTISKFKDDRSIAWSGREFERRMIDNLQVVTSLLNNDGDAFALAQRGMESVHEDARILQADRKIPAGDGDLMTVSHGDHVGQAIAPPRYSANRMVAYLSAAVSSERIMDADVTDRRIQQIAAWGESDAVHAASLQSFGTRSAPGTGVLQVITFAGRVTPWESERADPTSAALLIADRILSATADHTLPPTIAGVCIGRPVYDRRQQSERTIVSVPGSSPVASHTLLDVNQAAWDSYEADRDEQIARAIVRRIVKKGTVYAAKNSMAVGKGSVTDLAFNVAGIAWESLEKADLRHWELLPEAIEVAQLELPEGDHAVTLEVRRSSAGSVSGSAINRVEVPATIHNGRNTFIVCFRPQDRLVGIRASDARLETTLP